MIKSLADWLMLLAPCLVDGCFGWGGLTEVGGTEWGAVNRFGSIAGFGDLHEFGVGAWSAVAE
jgi:hypothetical protein